MKNRTKKIFLWSTIGLFLVIIPFIVAYAEGYKYSFKDNRFYLTGAITLKANTSAKVFIDDELGDDTSFFGNGFSRDGLLPGSYKLFLQKENYSFWRKVINVEERLVTDFPNVLLLPIEGAEREKVIQEIDEIFVALKPSPSPSISPTPKPSITPKISVSPSPVVYTEPLILKDKILYLNDSQLLSEIGNSVEGFTISENGSRVAYWSNHEVWVVWLEDQDYQPLHQKGERELITRFSSPIDSLTWFRGPDHVVVRFDINDRIDYRVVEIDTRGGVNIIEF